MTKVERILNSFKNHPTVSIVIIIGIVIISLATFKDALRSLFVLPDEKIQIFQQKMDKSPGSVQAGRDINIEVQLNKDPSVSRPLDRFPVGLQIRNAKERIRYLSQEYLKTDTLSLVEVEGAYGDNVLDSPQLYNWDKVMNELEKEGYIKVLRRTGNHIEFKVLLNSAVETLPLNVRLTIEAWKAYGDKKYEQAIKKAEECINEFERDAIPEQEELEKNNAPLPPLGKVSEAEKNAIFNRGLLNDVATCWLIKGLSLEKLGKIQEAIKAYCKASKFTYACTYDPGSDIFLSPSKKAKNSISFLQGRCE